MTGRAEVAGLAGKGAQGFMAAVCASDAGNPVMQLAAVKIAILKFIFTANRYIFIFLDTSGKQ